MSVGDKGLGPLTDRHSAPWRVGSALMQAIVLGCVIASPTLRADRILLVGDSWGWRRQESLNAVIVDNHGHQNVQISVPPKILFSNQLAASSGLQTLTKWLTDYPDTTVVHLSMGDNELSITPEQIGTQYEADVHAAIIRNVDIAVDHILSIAPEVRIVWSGYDFFRPRPYPKPAESNEIHQRFGQACADYAAAKDPRIIYSDLYGALQVAFGFDGVQHSTFDPSYAIPAGDPSLPDPQWPSPFEAYNPRDTDHPNPAGWRALAEAQYASYYGPLLEAAELQINAGLNDAWYNPATSGQGFLITVFPVVKQMFVAWFTYDTERPTEDVEAVLGEPGHRWLTAQGPYAGNTATLTIYVTEGGVFDAVEPRARNDGIGDGTMTIEFADCGEGLVTYEIASPHLSGEIPIQRIVNDNVAQCEALSSQ